MGSVCKKQDAENELNSLVPKKKGDTITISQNNGLGSIIQKKKSTGNKGDYEPDAIVEKIEVEVHTPIKLKLKRNDKKKLVKVEARAD
jgi:cGMP-dependent protein kinase